MPVTRLMMTMIQRRWRQCTGLLLPWVDRQTETVSSASAPPLADNRRHLRIPVKTTRVRVTDGCLVTTAEIDNISPAGICLSNMPEPLYRNAERLTVFSIDNPGLPVLHLRPCWERTDDWKGKTIGAMIVNTSASWHRFLTPAAG